MNTPIQTPQATAATTAPKVAPSAQVTPTGRFAAVLQATQKHAAADAVPLAPRLVHTVRAGDTLTGLIKKSYRAEGLPISESEAYRQALQLAKDNQIKNPNLIRPGETLNLDTVAKTIAALSNKTESDPAHGAVMPQIAASQQGDAVQAKETSLPPENLLGKTLQRAVDKGYLAPSERPAVAQKVLALSEKYKFQPDDFARLTLMESGGMNPKATNGRCHGIIQFCDGSSRGAAAVGMAHNPRAILGMGLLKQLDLVDAYFDHVGLADRQEAVTLDELYLTVLTPAARTEQRPDAPLAIPGRQAKDLHVGGNRDAPITRNSIIEGLHALARRIFDPDFTPRRQLSLYANQARTDG